MLAVTAAEHDDALQPFAEHQHRNVEDARAEIAVRRRIGESAGPQELEHQNRGDSRGGEGDEEGGNRRSTDEAAHARSTWVLFDG